MAAEVRLHPRSPPQVSSFLLRLLPITRKGEGYPCQALPPCSGHHERLVPGWWHPSARGAARVSSCCEGTRVHQAWAFSNSRDGKVSTPRSPLPWGAEGQLSRDTKPLCTLRCAVRAGDIGAGMLTLIPEQPQGRGRELSWVVSEVGAEPWTLRKVCLQNTDSGDL